MTIQSAYPYCVTEATETEDAPFDSDEALLNGTAPTAVPDGIVPTAGLDSIASTLEQTAPAAEPEKVAPTSVLDDSVAEPDKAAGSADVDVSKRTLPFKRGDVVEATVVKVDSDGALLDLGTWIEGVAVRREIALGARSAPDAHVSVADRVRGLVTSIEGPDGRPRVSLARLVAEESWSGIEAAVASDGIVSGTVVEAVKGGLRIDAGVSAFLPASLIDLHPVSDLKSYVGRQLDVKILEADKKRMRVVVSRRAILEGERRAMRSEVFAKLNEGDVVDGTVSAVTDIGAFVDVGGADGLVHVTEMSWSRVGNPKKFISAGTPVKVKVLDLDQDRDRISLSLKQVAENPWDQFIRVHRTGDVIVGKVTKTVDFGAFVEVAEGIEGLVHISQVASHRIDKVSDVLHAGEEVEVRLLEMDLARQRLSLSIRAVADPEAANSAPRGGGDGGGGGGGGRRGSQRGRGAPSTGRGRGGGGGGRGRGGKGMRSYSSGGDGSEGGLKAALRGSDVDALDALKEQLSRDADSETEAESSDD